MPTSHRRCSTCRHFQPAPLWRKGWCRNPLLYAPHQNHLVDERDLDCDRHFGDYWEPVEVAADAPAAGATSDMVAAAGAAPPTGQARVATLTDDEPDAADTAPAAALTDPMTVVRPTRLTAEPRSRAAAATPADEPRSRRAPEGRSGSTGAATPRVARPPVLTRTRADYLRLAGPAVIILLLLIGYTIWAGVLVRNAATPATPVATISSVLPSPTAMPTAAPISAASPIAATRPASPSPTSAPAIIAPTRPAATAPPATASPATPAPAGLRPGGTAIVSTEPPDNLRLRRDPGRTGVILRSIRSGERLTLVEGPREVDGQAWWKVTYAGETGWVAASFIRPAP